MKGFTLIELIFVIIIAGILTFVGFEYIPDNTLISDYEMLKHKILQKRANAIGYKYDTENNLTCIKFDKDWLNIEDNASHEKVHYFFKSTITSSNGVSKICFDYLGRDYNISDESNDNEIVDLTKMLHNFIIITLNYKNEEKNITIYPLTGAIK